MVPTCIKFLLADSTFDSTLLFYYVGCVFDDFVNPADSSHINSLLTMDNKRDATNADLPWPNPPLRPNFDGPPLPGTPSSTSSASTPSATIPATAASSSAPDPTGLAPYASDPSANGAPPFPPMDTSWEHRNHYVFFRAGNRLCTKCSSKSSPMKINGRNCGSTRSISKATPDSANLSNTSTF